MAAYTRIILPLDGSDTSEQAIPHARGLAMQLSLPVTLVCAVEPDSPAITQSLYSNRRWIEPAGSRHAEASEYLTKASDLLVAEGMRVDTAIPHRDPAGGIVEEAGRDPNALIVIASHGRSGLARWWLGSVADKVLHTADNPVFVIRVQGQAFKSPDERPGRLFVPLDGSELAEMVLPHVSYLASRMGLPVTLLQITPSEEEYYRYAAMGSGFAPASVPSAPSVFELVQMAGQEASAYLEDVKSRLVGQGVETVDTQVTPGTAADVIVDQVSEAEGGLVAMTTHGRSGVGRMMLGSVAERVIRQSGCPVLVVRAGQDD